jgi:hypothetical protein
VWWLGISAILTVKSTRIVGHEGLDGVIEKR